MDYLKKTFSCVSRFTLNKMEEVEKVRKKKRELESEIVRLEDEVDRKEHSSKTRFEIVERLSSRIENVEEEIRKRRLELSKLEVCLIFFLFRVMISK
jgi:SMC interacting uncharacterized protein involved in chromosome segregation